MANETLIDLLDKALHRLWKLEGDRKSVVDQLNAALTNLASARELIISRDAEIAALSKLLDGKG